MSARTELPTLWVLETNTDKQLAVHDTPLLKLAASKAPNLHIEHGETDWTRTFVIQKDDYKHRSLNVMWCQVGS